MELQPEDSSVRRLQADLRASRQKYANNSKKMAARVVRDANVSSATPVPVAAEAMSANTCTAGSTEAVASEARVTVLSKVKQVVTDVTEYQLVWAIAVLVFAVVLPDQHAPAALVLLSVLAAAAAVIHRK